MKPTLINAVLSLCPDAEVVVRGDEVEWINPSVQPFTDKELADELKRLQKQYDANEYQRLRAQEYPDFKDYLDGVVKNDQNQIQQYIDACLAVKLKYPKP